MSAVISQSRFRGTYTVLPDPLAVLPLGFVAPFRVNVGPTRVRVTSTLLVDTRVPNSSLPLTTSSEVIGTLETPGFPLVGGLVYAKLFFSVADPVTLQLGFYSPPVDDVLGARIQLTLATLKGDPDEVLSDTEDPPVTPPVTPVPTPSEPGVPPRRVRFNSQSSSVVEPLAVGAGALLLLFGFVAMRRQR